MTTPSIRSYLPLVFLLLAAGCSRAHGIDPIRVPDTGTVPPSADAGPRGSRVDAGPREVDAGATCEGWTLVDATPLHFDAVGALGSGDELDRQSGSLTVASAGDTAWIGHLHGNPSPCDGACLGLESIESAGPLAGFLPLYWLPSLSGNRGDLHVVGHPDGGVLAWGAGRSWDAAGVEETSTVAWQVIPQGDEPWRADGERTLADGEIAMSMVPLADGGTALLVAEEGEPDGYVRLRRILELDPEGDFRRAYEAEPLVISFDVLDARLVPSHGLPWLVTREDWDFPPTVQVRRIDGTGNSLVGWSCGVDDFDAVDLFDGAAVGVVQRCGGRVEIAVRPDDIGEPLAVTEAASAVAPRVAALPFGDHHFVVAFVREGDPAPTLALVMQVEPGLLLVDAELTLPADPGVELPVRAVDLDVLDDGTIVTAWHGQSAGDFSGSSGAVARARVCR